MLIIRAPEGCRRLTRWAAATALAITLCGGAAAAPQQRGQGESVIVVVDHAKVVRLPEKAQTVVVGNPAIADVSVQRNGVMIVTGKSFGVTNLIALDANGALLAESLVRVGAASDAVLTVQRGMERESYACNPDCQPSVQMGDGQNYFAGVAGQTTARNALATTATRN
jgi:Flp pilus assembly secretin CpaC